MGFKTPFNRLLLAFVCIASVYCFLVDPIFAIRVIECTPFKCNESSSERNNAPESTNWFFIREASNVTNGSCLSETNLTSNNECSILNITTERAFLNFTSYQENIVANSSCKRKFFILNASTTLPDKFASAYNLSTNRTLCSLNFHSPSSNCMKCVENTMLLNSNLSSVPSASSSPGSNDFMRVLEKHKILFIVGGCLILVLSTVFGCMFRRRAKRSITRNLEVIVSPLPNPSNNPLTLRFSEHDDNYCYPEFKESGSRSSEDSGEYSYAYAHPIGYRGNTQELFFVNTMNTTKDCGYEECRPANSGYEECRPAANSGYEECRPVNSGYEECRPVNSGYEECRADLSFYEECRPVATDGGVSGKELSRSHTSLERTWDEQDGQDDIDTTVVNYVDVL